MNTPDAAKRDNRKSGTEIKAPESPWPGGDPNNFVAVVDETTFGVKDGVSFVVGGNASFDFTLWAEANAMYFFQVACRIARFAAVRKAELLQRANAVPAQPTNKSAEERQQQNEKP